MNRHILYIRFSILIRFILFFFLVFTLTHYYVAHAEDQSNENEKDKRDEILKVINLEIQEINRLGTTTSKASPELVFRKAELYMEKARIIKEKENEKYISLDPKIRLRTNKESFFKDSNFLFREANRLCESIVKFYPNFKDIGDVYYILGYNAKEFGQDQTANQYLSRARTSGTASPKTLRKASLTQADLFYNNKLYDKAAILYEKALASKDRWWTKDSFNLAWCYLKTQRKEKALKLMLEIYDYSARDEFINMKPQVERDIGYFYIENNKIEDALAFYKRLKKSFTSYIIKMADNLSLEGQFTKASELFTKALEIEENEDQKRLIKIKLLDFYAKYNQTNQHLATCKDLSDEYASLSQDDKKVYIYQVQRMGSLLQNQVANKTYATNKKVQLEKALMSREYYGLLILVDRSSEVESYFFRAETAFAAEKYEEALKDYFLTIELAKSDVQKKKYLAPSMEGILGSLGQKNVSADTQEKYFEKAFVTYLQLDSKSKRSQDISVRLFNYYLEKNQMEKAHQVLMKFSQHHPAEVELQEAMVAKLIKHYHDKKDQKSVTSYIQAINADQIKVSSVYKEKLKKLLTNMQMSEAQKSLDAGNNSKALTIYEKILNDPNATAESKNNAHYNLAVLYYQQAMSQQTYDHAITAINTSTSDQIKEYSSSYISLATFLFSQLHFDKAANLASLVSTKICQQNHENLDVSVRNAFYLYLADNQINKAHQYLTEVSSCKISKKLMQEMTIELMREYKDNAQFTEMTSLFNKNSNDTYIAKEAIGFFKTYFEKLKDSGNISEINSWKPILVKQFETLKKQKIDIPIESIEVIAEIKMEGLRELTDKFKNIILVFPEQQFNQILKNKLELLGQIISYSKEIEKYGSGHHLLAALRVVDQSYEEMIQQLSQFSPPEQSEEYVKSFKASMTEIWSPLRDEQLKQKKWASQIAQDNQILSEHTSYFVIISDVKFFNQEHFYSMERSGK